MRSFAFLLVCCGLSSGLGAQVTDLSIKEQPMYGFTENTYTMSASDKKFVDSMIVSLGSPELAYKESLKRAWAFKNSGDLSMAIVRANQAWLFKKDDYEVYYLFGTVVAEKSYREPSSVRIELISEAINYYTIALSRNPSHGMSYANIGRLSRDLVVANTQFRVKTDQNQKLFDLFWTYLERAEGLTTDAKGLGYIFYQLAINNAMAGNLNQAWQMIHKERKADPDYPEEPDFIKNLAEDMPDPGPTE